MKLAALAILLYTTLATSHASTEKPPSRRESLGQIMYWWGKVNQHVDSRTGAWVTDPDGVSGADIDWVSEHGRSRLVGTDLDFTAPGKFAGHRPAQAFKLAA